MRWRPPRFMVITSGIGAVVGGSVILKDFIIGKSQEIPRTVRADGKVIVITGANTGIGKETALEMAKRGGKVYMACRDLKRCEDARVEIVKESQNGQVYCRHCDLADFNSIRRFANEFKRHEPILDVLINNAGVMRCPRWLTKQGIEMQLGVNHMGHFLLTHLLIDPLKKPFQSRVIVLSSIAHARGEINFDDLNSEKSYDPGAAYNQSKLANMLFARELGRRLQGSGVTVNTVHPGIVNTELGRHMGISNSILASIFVKPLLSFFLKSPKQGARTVVCVALDPKMHNITGKYFSDCRESKSSAASRDDALAKKLWITSEKWTQLSDHEKLP